MTLHLPSRYILVDVFIFSFFFGGGGGRTFCALRQDFGLCFVRALYKWSKNIKCHAYMIMCQIFFHWKHALAPSLWIHVVMSFLCLHCIQAYFSTCKGHNTAKFVFPEIWSNHFLYASVLIIFCTLYALLAALPAHAC